MSRLWIVCNCKTIEADCIDCSIIVPISPRSQIDCPRPQSDKMWPSSNDDYKAKIRKGWPVNYGSVILASGTNGTEQRGGFKVVVIGCSKVSSNEINYLESVHCDFWNYCNLNEIQWDHQSSAKIDEFGLIFVWGSFTFTLYSLVFSAIPSGLCQDARIAK